MQDKLLKQVFGVQSSKLENQELTKMILDQNKGILKENERQFQYLGVQEDHSNKEKEIDYLQEINDCLNDLEFVWSDFQQISQSQAKLRYKKSNKISKKQKEDLEEGYQQSYNINWKQQGMILAQIKSLVSMLITTNNKTSQALLQSKQLNLLQLQGYEKLQKKLKQIQHKNQREFMLQDNSSLSKKNSISFEQNSELSQNQSQKSKQKIVSEVNSQSNNASWTMNQLSNEFSESKSNSLNLEYEQLFQTEKENYQNKQQKKTPFTFEGNTLNFLCPDEEKLSKIIDSKSNENNAEPLVIKQESMDVWNRKTETFQNQNFSINKKKINFNHSSIKSFREIQRKDS